MPTRAQLNNDLANVLIPIVDIPQHLQANQLMLDYLDQEIAAINAGTSIWLTDKPNYYTKSQVDVIAGTKASAVHTHPISDVVNLQTTLNLKADLVDGKIPQSQLPSYVDDVLEFANLAAFPSTGETSKIYLAIDTNFPYRWSGSSYVKIADGAPVSGSPNYIQNQHNYPGQTANFYLKGTGTFSGNGDNPIQIANPFSGLVTWFTADGLLRHNPTQRQGGPDPFLVVSASGAFNLYSEGTGIFAAPAGNDQSAILLQGGSGQISPLLRLRTSAGASNLALFDDGTVAAVTGSFSGSLSIGASLTVKLSATSNNKTLGAADYFEEVNVASGNRNITLPSAVGIAGRVYKIKKTDSSSNTVTINTSLTQTIDGLTEYILTKQWEGISVISNGTNWLIEP